jgi:hypothetical protein
LSIVRILTLGSLAVALLIAAAGPAAAAAPRPVAIVYSLTGEASLTAPGVAGRPVRLFDRLSAGTIVEAGPGARLALAFMNGLRFEMGEGSRVKIGPQGLASQAGPVRALPRVPPLPRLSSIAAKDRPGPRAGAVRIRAKGIEGLYPRSGAAALADGAVLRFQPIAGVRSYRIEVQDRQGRIVFRTDAESPPVEVPAGKLDPGLSYLWTVRTLDLTGAVARGEAALVTLDEEASQAREKARKILAAEGPDSLPLLAEIDRSLGLLLEAREELKAAMIEKPGDSALREALAEIETLLEYEDDPG